MEELIFTSSKLWEWQIPLTSFYLDRKLEKSFVIGNKIIPEVERLKMPVHLSLK